MSQNNGLTNKELLSETREDVKFIRDEIVKNNQWIKDHTNHTGEQNKRLNNYSKRIRFIEIIIGGIVGVPSIILFLYKLGLINL